MYILERRWYDLYISKNNNKEHKMELMIIATVLGSILGCAAVVGLFALCFKVSDVVRYRKIRKANEAVWAAQEASKR